MAIISPQEILTSLHHLLSHNVIGDLQYNSRYKGFVGELEFSIWLGENRPTTRTFSGGYFIPTVPGADTLDSPLYFTVSDDDPKGYLPIYARVSRLKCKAMFFIRWSGEDHKDWTLKDVMGTGTPLPVPELRFFVFDMVNHVFTESRLEELLKYFPLARLGLKPHASNESRDYFLCKLAKFPIKALTDLYVQRLVFDGYIGAGKERGLPSDIDFILYSEISKELQFIELKEKDLSKREPVGFGMDVHRILNLKKITEVTELKLFYIVRRVDNQTERNFMEWRIIDILDFERNLSRNIIQGGIGMRAENSDNPTMICPLEHFKVLSTVR